MKQIILIFLFLPLYLNAQSFLISNIPLPKSYIQNLDPYPCDELCMQEYLNNGMIFSFLSHAESQLESIEHNDVRMMSVSIFNLGSIISTNKIRIAMLLPYKIIGRYASSTTNAAFAYLIARNHAFELKSYEIENETNKDITKALSKIKADGFNYVIAPFTKTGADIVADINPDVNIYFPTIHKNNVDKTTASLFYGAIDYEQQSDLLLSKAVSPLVIFRDNSSIGKRLSSHQEHMFKYKEYDETLSNINILNNNKTVIKFSIPRRTTNLESKLKENEDIQKASFFINTPVVKTGMIMSQLTLYDSNATNVLSTQINYDPLLLSMTQYQDRKNMLIANSITEHHSILIEANSLLSNDIVYDWINYSTTVGIDYFFNLITNENREYNIPVQDNQMIYKIELLRPVMSRFIKIY